MEDKTKLNTALHLIPHNKAHGIDDKPTELIKAAGINFYKLLLQHVNNIYSWWKENDL